MSVHQVKSNRIGPGCRHACAGCKVKDVPNAGQVKRITKNIEALPARGRSDRAAQLSKAANESPADKSI